MVQEKELILGIDDAGRGPLIGPMAMAGVIIDSELEAEFKELGVKDSKLIFPRKREKLAKIIREKAIAFHVYLISALEIDTRIKTGINLNKVEAIKAAELINKLTKGRKEKIKVIIDCPSPNRDSWKGYVMKKVLEEKNLTVLCEHKADRDYIAVGAASILAKSEREKAIAQIRKEIGEDFGSGYPNDPKTKEFLSKFGKKYTEKGLFRETWATFKNHAVVKKQKNLFEF